MRTRKSNAPSREKLASFWLALGGTREDTFHVRHDGRLVRLSTRPSVHKADLKNDLSSITSWIENEQVFAVLQAKFHVLCHDKPSWKREGQYNLSANSVRGIVHPVLELL